jgi:hypothetical protein
VILYQTGTKNLNFTAPVDIGLGLTKNLIIYQLPLEVEDSAKKIDAYQNIARFYNSNKSMGYIVWVCDNKSIAKRLFEEFKRGRTSGMANTFNLLLSDNDAHGWASFGKFGAQTGSP